MNLPWSNVTSQAPEKVTSPQNLIDRSSHTNVNLKKSVTSRIFLPQRSAALECCAKLNRYPLKL